MQKKAEINIDFLDKVFDVANREFQKEYNKKLLKLGQDKNIVVQKAVKLPAPTPSFVVSFYGLEADKQKLINYAETQNLTIFDIVIDQIGNIDRICRETFDGVKARTKTEIERQITDGKVNGFLSYGFGFVENDRYAVTILITIGRNAKTINPTAFRPDLN